MTDFDGKKYIWNGENRLIAMEPETLAAGQKKVTLIYDYKITFHDKNQTEITVQK